MKLFSYTVKTDVRGTEREEVVVAPSPDAAARAMKLSSELSGGPCRIIKVDSLGENA